MNDINSQYLRELNALVLTGVGRVGKFLGVIIHLLIHNISNVEFHLVQQMYMNIHTPRDMVNSHPDYEPMWDNGETMVGCKIWHLFYVNN